MAVWEARQQVTSAKGGNVISQVSWTDGTALDTYYWLANSFQYSANINCDDEMHWIKLASRADFTPNYWKCQLISLWEHGVMALPVDTDDSWDEIFLKRFQYNWYYRPNWNTWQDWPLPLDDWEPVSKWTIFNEQAWSTYKYTYDTVAWVVFQDRLWFASNRISNNVNYWYISSVPCWLDVPVSTTTQDTYLPYDHNDYTDESIETATHVTDYMRWNITAILNYNNTRLVVAAWQDIWVYYPELDNHANPDAKYDGKYWTQGWKKVLTYEPWVVVVALTCTFEYLKVWAVDEWWNTKVYYYQGNNNLRSTFVYNLVDLTWVRVLHVYSINGVDYYTSSIDWSDWLIDFNKMVGATPIRLFSQRAGKTVFDVNNKAPYFVWPTSMSWDYNNGYLYVADAYGVFRFLYNPQGYDKWYMKRKLNNNKQVYWLCVNQWFLYVSDSDGCRAMRLYDTWVDGYQPSGVLISREFEWREWWTVTKMLDEIRMNFELNPMVDPSDYWANTEPYWKIDIYVSPNNLWKSTSVFTRANNWYHVMSINKDSSWTRAEKSNLFNDLNSGESAFKFDWQTITYAVVITRWAEERATPIVREIDIKYHCKDKVNNVYDIN